MLSTRSQEPESFSVEKTALQENAKGTDDALSASRTGSRASSAMIVQSLILGLCILLASCAEKPGVKTEPKVGATGGERISLELVPGSQYSRRMGFLMFGYTVVPQIAVWIESEDGKYIRTLYVTDLAVSGKFRAAPKSGRPEVLPVWTALTRSEAAAAGSRATDLKESIDAVSSPSVSGSAVRFGNDSVRMLPAGTYIIKAETNRSYDWNARYTKLSSGVNGQPSIIYSARLETGNGRREATFVPLGTGSVDGSDGEIQPGIEGIDTALELFSSMKVSYETE